MSISCLLVLVLDKLLVGRIYVLVKKLAIVRVHIVLATIFPAVLLLLPVRQNKTFFSTFYVSSNYDDTYFSDPPKTVP